MYTASTIIERARFLADLPNARFITYSDELNSLNEAYRDVYTWLTNTDDDYYIKSAQLSLVDAVPNQPYAYRVDLPEDFYRLRFISYLGNGGWTKMRKFSPEARDSAIGPRYRFYGRQLWVIGVAGLTEIKVDYYPPADIITLPELAHVYGSTIPVYDRGLLSLGSYVEAGQTMIYGYNGSGIRAESIANASIQAPVTLLAAAGSSNVQYYKGYIYYLIAGDIYRATTNLIGAGAPVQITSSGDIDNFRVLSDNLIHYSTSTEIRSCALNGSADTLTIASTGKDFSMIDMTLAYLNATDNIVIGATTYPTTAIALAGQSNELYYLSADGTLYRTNIDMTISSIVAEDVASIGQVADNYMPVITKDDDIMAISLIPDWLFDYPVNEVNEIIAYQCAIDFKRKQNSDASALQLRKLELQQRISSVFGRDDGLPERIGNAYETSTYYR